MSSRQQSNCQQCEQPIEQHCCTAVYRRNKAIEYVSYDKWLPNVRIQAPDVPDTILLDFIRRACIEFATKSNILTRNIWIKTQDCVADYYPCLGEQERIDSVLLLSVNGRCYQSVGNTCSWNVGNSKFWFHPPNSLEIHPAPKSCSEVLLTVIAVPTENSSKVDKLIHDRYFEAIENYAVGKAHLIPDMPATSGQAHTYRLNEFKKTVNKAKIDIVQNYSKDTKAIGGHHGCLC